MTVLTTQRLTLRPVTAEDAEILHAHWNRPLVRRYLFDGEEVSAALVVEIIGDSVEDFEKHGFGLWAMVAGEIIGVCGLRLADDETVEILYSLDPGRWGEGLATEAVRAVLLHGRRVGLREVLAETDEGNDASVRLVERLGGVRRDTRKNSRRYAISLGSLAGTP